MKKHKAFTLAETLITLGIIGVVAAITIPGLIYNYKAHRLQSQFLKSYSTLQQVFKRMEADDVSLDPSTYPTGTFYQTFGKYLQAPLIVIEIQKIPPATPEHLQVNNIKVMTAKQLFNITGLMTDKLLYKTVL